LQARFPNRVMPYLLLAPSAVVVFVFFIIPSAQSLYLSFYQVSAIGDRRIFVGWRNFEQLLRSSEYSNSIWVSLVFAVAVVIGGLALSLAVAVAANQRFRGFHIYRTLLIWPYALSPAIAGIIWALMFDPAIGVATQILKGLTGIAFNWRVSSTQALAFITVAAIWKMLGYNVIFFLSGLQGIPEEQLEAAALDGANAWRRFWAITFPLLSPMTFFLFVMNTLYAFFQVFGLVHITTEGGPGRATDLLIYKLYRDGFIGMNTGLASAESILLLIMVSVLTILQFRYAGERVFYQ